MKLGNRALFYGWPSIKISRDEDKMAQYFDGYEAKVIKNPGETVVYYGGSGMPDGPGHGHVRATGGLSGDNIVYWRLPDSEGGRVIISNAWDVAFGHGNDLSSHITGF